ncbi:hypothetical protein BC629DRAFT_1593116 [Irpex lacteus]|nr:hypothetical protein BC629DRAFT_1593116 [Irpex lacteus]
MGSPASFAHGPGLLGTIFNVFLYGIMVTQCFLYFARYPKDKLWMKVMVLLLFLADTLNCVFDVWWIYDSLVNNFNNPAALETANWVFATDPAMVGIISAAVQLFFAWRVKILSGSWIIVIIIIITSIASIIGGVGTAIYIHYIPQFDRFQEFQALVVFWRVCSAICDAVITAVLIWYLRKHRTGFHTTDVILDSIIRLTVQTGLITTIWATADLVSYLVTPTGLHLVFNFALAKLYTNSLMSTLNARPTDRDIGYDSTGISERKTKSVDTARRPDVVTLPRQEVFVHVESHEMVDLPSKPDIEWLANSSNSPTIADHP